MLRSLPAVPADKREPGGRRFDPSTVGTVLVIPHEATSLEGSGRALAAGAEPLREGFFSRLRGGREASAAVAISADGAGQGQAGQAASRFGHEAKMRLLAGLVRSQRWWAPRAPPDESRPQPLANTGFSFVIGGGAGSEGCPFGTCQEPSIH